MRTYELIVVFESSLEIEQMESELRRLQDVITRGEGKIRKWERWGKRRLAYEIRRRQYGYYVLVIFDVEAELVAELNRVIRMTPTVIRHMITVVDPPRVPEVDEESVRSLGAAAAEAAASPPPPDAASGKPAPAEDKADSAAGTETEASKEASGETSRETETANTDGNEEKETVATDGDVSEQDTKTEDKV